ncbi:hypothetical protein PT279_06405 [Bifidobacterium sp. ESL0784]|uniref:hypothetical protein n=1 Tax=Bifidobacterium sp. ESL0784 TaxID=2983231 RepID=UPI0023F859A6|nr:hypothetical protein [Bifidobacterium sp. ESL0784]MDF7641218.1 hypothetical protein [Bifidobacterium sp. ESL0784]
MSERRDDSKENDDFKNFNNSDDADNVSGSDSADNFANTKGSKGFGDSDNVNGSADSNDDNGGLFSDEELEKALAGFEKEFADDPDGKNVGMDDDGRSSENPGMNGTDSSLDGVDDSAEQSDRRITDELDKMNFDEELEGLIGNRAKVAILITRLISADLLAAFCQIADISADCVADENGAVAILHNLDGDAPEGAAKDLTGVVNGMPAVLSVNRADKLVSTLYMAGEPGQQFAPPMLFTTAPSCVEDLMLGITDVAGLKEQGVRVVATADFDRKKAFEVIADHTRSRGSGKPNIE